MVLRYLYAIAELGEQAVGRVGFRTSYAAIRDRSATRQVKGHSEDLLKALGSSRNS